MASKHPDNNQTIDRNSLPLTDEMRPVFEDSVTMDTDHLHLLHPKHQSLSSEKKLIEFS